MANYSQSFNICGFYQTTHHLGIGASGDVWKAFNVLTGLQVALKLKARSRDGAFPPLLEHEVSIYRLLYSPPEGIPSIHWSGFDGNHYIVVMDLLGPTLDSLRRLCRGSLTLRTICMLAEQLLTRLQFIHSRGVISGDVKPNNLAMGVDDEARILYLFDFSHAQLFINPSTGDHIPFRAERNTMGTLRYASVPAHLNHEVSRRDDIESSLYVLMELYHGQLPWHTFSSQHDQDLIRRIGDMKAGREFAEFLGGSIPEFRAYHAHCTGLSFGEKPDYAYLKALFRERMRIEGWAYDWKFDWEEGTSLDKGTLVPEEYVFDLRFVERLALDPK